MNAYNIDPGIEASRSHEMTSVPSATSVIFPSVTPSEFKSGFSMPCTLVLAVTYSSISGLLFGYQMGVMGGALHSLQSSLQLTSSQTESVSSLFFIGLMIASPFGGYACDRLGRRSSIIYMDIGFFVAAVFLAVAPSYEVILAGRFIAGCSSGISLVAAVSYLTELANADQHHFHRGALVSTLEASVSLGFLVSYLASYAFTAVADYFEGWRILFGATGFFALTQWVGMLRMPESPEWLAEKGFHYEAQAALCRLTLSHVLDENDNGDETLAGNDTVVHAESRTPNTVHTCLDQRLSLEYGEVSFFLLNDCPSVAHYWRQAIIIAFLAAAEQFCGHINIINYAPVIFAEEFYNYDENEATENDQVASELLTTTIILGIVKLIITTFVLFEVDKLGRRFLLKAGTGIVTVSLLLLAIGFSVTLEKTSVLNSGEIEHTHTRPQHALVLVGCSGVVAGFALSYGPITWLITAELSPSSIRGRMLGFYTVITHGCAAIISYTFLSVQERYGEAAPFWFYFTCSLVSFFFIEIAVPETGGVADSEGEDVGSLLDDTQFWGQDNMLNSCFSTFKRKILKRRNRSVEELGRIDSCFDDVGASVGIHRSSM